MWTRVRSFSYIYIGYSSQNDSGENENFKHFDCVKVDEI